MKDSLWLGVTLLAIGVYALYSGAETLYRNSDLVLNGMNTEARVVSIDVVHRRGPGDRIYPIFEFYVNGESFRVKNSEPYKRPFDKEIGDTVDIRYNPSDPNSAVISSLWSLIISPLLQPLVGAGFIIAVGFEFLVHLRGLGRTHP